MASTVYSEQLVVVKGLSSVPVTVPDDRVWIVKMITLFAGASDGAYVQIIQGAYGDGPTLYYGLLSISPSGSYHYDSQLYLVFPPGTELTIVGSGGIGGDAPDVGLFGYSLTPPL